MFYLQRFVLPVLLILSLHAFSVSQVKFSAGPTVGMTLPSGDYSGTTIDYYNGTKYGLGSGVNFGAVLKAGFSVVTIKASLNFSSLSNSGNSEPGQGSVNVKQKLFMIGIGPEFGFSLKGSPVKPYAGIDLLFTSFSGETSFQGVSKVPSGTYSMSSSSRTGIGFGIGAEFSVAKKYALDLNIKYNMLNLMGKDFTGGPDRINSYLALNDEKDPLYPDDKHPIGSSRSISVIQFNLAFLFGF
ncbi:MAG TPA: outer membrane beta-barrel protein [Ignavibacteria bacterium]